MKHQTGQNSASATGILPRGANVTLSEHTASTQFLLTAESQGKMSAGAGVR